MFSFETLASWEQRFCWTPWFTLCACQSVFMPPVSFPASSLLCSGQVGGKGAATRTRGTLLPLGEELGREMRSQQFKEEVKTKLNLLSTHPLKAGGVLCLLNPPLVPVTNPSLSSLVLLPTNSSLWHLPSFPGLPSLAGPSLLSPQSRKEFPPLLSLWISSPKAMKLPHFARGYMKEQAPHAAGWNKPSSSSDRQQFTTMSFCWSTEIWMLFLHLKISFVNLISSS